MGPTNLISLIQHDQPLMLGYTSPMRALIAADLPSGAAAGDAITVDGTAYTVRVIQPEGTGVTTLVLEKN